MPQLIKVAEVKDIPPGDSKCVSCGNERIALFNVDGEFYAISDMCPHAGGPLSEGWVEDGEVTCPWHGWSFKLKSGGGMSDGVERYRVHVEGEVIKIELPD
jgi:nitrite reductase (NADH) small subunit